MLSPIEFRFEYAGHGWGIASISDGITIYDMEPSYVEDPLFGLVAAIDNVLSYGEEAVCTWDYEPITDDWLLRRDGDVLHITIQGERRWPPDYGGVHFSTTVPPRRFAAKLRTAVSRLQPVEESYSITLTGVQNTPEYRVLCTFLDEHKRARTLAFSPGQAAMTAQAAQ